MNRRRLGEWIVSRSAKPHYRNRVDASVSGGERETPAPDEKQQCTPTDTSTYTSDEQRRIAEDAIADVDASGLWPGKVVTEISEAVPFWEADAEHQDYLQRYPDGYTCHFPRPAWKLPHRETAA